MNFLLEKVTFVEMNWGKKKEKKESFFVNIFLVATDPFQHEKSK